MKILPILLAFTVLTSLTACEEKQTKVQEQPRPVIAMQVGRLQDESRKFPGEAQAADAVTLAFEVPGKLTEVTVNVGDAVKKGQVLASLDPRDFENAANVARAALERSSAHYRRIKQAANMNAVSQQDLTDARAAFDAAAAELEIREKALEDSILKAPYDGVISAKFVESFSNVIAKEPAIRIVDPDRIEMVVDVPENMIMEARHDLKILVSFDAFPDREFIAHITEIGAEASPVTRTYPVTLTIEMPDDIKIKPGMTGRAWVAEPRAGQNDAGGFVVPVTAIGEDGEGKKFVWVIDGKNRTVSKRKVTIGEIREGGVVIWPSS